MIIENLKTGVLLTPRDYSILDNLYNYTAMSFSQIKEKSFSSNTKATAINRLTKLQEAGLILRKRIPRFLQSGTDLQISVVYQITKEGIKRLQKRSSEILRQEPVSLHALSIDHDLLLNEVIDKLKSKFRTCKIVNGKLHVTNGAGVSPDAICVIANDKIAIELELNLKSEQRYRELILKYRLSQDFKKVLYVTDNQAIKVKLKELISQRNLPNGENVFTDKFYFVDLGDLLSAKANLQISNGKENFLTDGGHL